MRIDQFLWCIRYYKTRNLSNKACKNGHIKINNKMYIKTEMLKYNRGIAKCSANCSIDNQIMSSSLFTILLPDEIKKFTKKNAN